MPCFKFRGGKDKKNKISSSGYSYTAALKEAQEDTPALSPPPLKKIASKASVKNLGRLFKELECPVCYNTCTPPIETCKNGHIICATCRLLMCNCPTCRERFTGTRNFFAENFINQYAQYCKFKSEGCEYLRWKGENMSPHEATCQFRNIDCMVPSCPKPLPYSSLLDHLVNEHKIGGSEKLPTKISYDVLDPIVSSRKWLPYFIKSYGNVFYVMMEVIRPSFYIWVWIQETKKVASSQANDFAHVVNIRLQSADKKMHFNWEGPVHSIRTPATKIRESGTCLVVPESMMQHYEKDSQITINLDIERRKVEPVPSITVTKEATEIGEDEIPDEIFHPPSTNPTYPELFSHPAMEPNLLNNNNRGPYHSQR